MSTGIETAKPGSVLLQVAATGNNLAPLLFKYANNWPYHQIFVTELATTVALTSSLLKDLGTILSTYGDEIQLEEKSVCLDIEEIFDRVQLALKNLLEEKVCTYAGFGPVQSDGVLTNEMGVHRERKVGSRLLLEELGGVPPIGKKLNSRLQDAKDHLWVILEATKFLALRILQKREALELRQERELNRIVQQMPTILQYLERAKAEILQSVEQLKVEANIGDAQEIRDGPAMISAEVDGLSRGQRNRRERDEDVLSVVSLDSLASNQFLDVKEVYEAWVVRRMDFEENTIRRSWGFLGLRVSEYFNDFAYSVEPQQRSREELAEESEVVRTGEFNPEQVAFMKRTMASLPGRIRYEIEILVEDRERFSSNVRFARRWQVVEIKPTLSKFENEPVTWMRWWKEPPGTITEWLVVLKGETIDPGKFTKPARQEDPFRKPGWRRRVRSDRYGPVEPQIPPGQKHHGRGQTRQSVVDQLDAEAVAFPRKITTPEEAEKIIEGIMADIGGSPKEPLENRL